MLKSSVSFSISITIISIFTFFFLMMESNAQETETQFKPEVCLKELENEGLNVTEASVWCNYKQRCIARSQKEGLPPDIAKNVCDCTIAEYRNQYTTEKFKELTQQIDNNPKIATQLREVGEKCFEKILFE